MSAINELGNGSGYLYETLQDGTLTCVRANTESGVRDMRTKSSVNAPIAANRSAVATITVTAVASTGAWTAVTVSGVNQIAGNISILTSNTTTEAERLAAAINAFTPASGLDYVAEVNGNVISLIEPPSGGGASNGITPVVSANTGTATTTILPFEGGAPVGGVYDSQFGRLYLLNAAPDAPADDPSIATDITKYLTERGTQVGVPNLTLTLANNGLTIDRYADRIQVKMLNEGAAGSDNLVAISTIGMVEGDLIQLCAANDSELTTIVSQPNAGGVSSNPNANIYLNGDANFVTTGITGSALTLRYTFDDSVGGIFTEVSRSSSNAAINYNNTVIVDASFGSDTDGARESFTNPFQTIPAGIAALQSGDQLYVRAGTYTAAAAGSFNVLSTNKMYCEAGVNLVSAQSSTLLTNLYGYADITAVALSIAGIINYNSITLTNELDIYFPNTTVLNGGDITFNLTGTPRGIRIEGDAGSVEFNIRNIIYNQSGATGSPTAWGAICINNITGAKIKGTLNNIYLSGNANNIAGITILDGVTPTYDSNVDIRFNSIIGSSSMTGTLLMAGIYIQSISAPVTSSIANITGNLIDVSATTITGGIKNQSGTLGVSVKKVITGAGIALSVGDDGGGACVMSFTGDLIQTADNTQHAAIYLYNKCTLNFNGSTGNKYFGMFAVCDGSTLNIISGEAVDTGNNQNQAIQVKNTFINPPHINMGNCKISKQGANKNLVLITTDTVAFFKGTDLYNISGSGGTGKSVISGGATNISLLSLFSNIDLDSTITNTTTNTDIGIYS
jgi:hypothetical protein